MVSSCILQSGQSFFLQTCHVEENDTLLGVACTGTSRGIIFAAQVSELMDRSCRVEHQLSVEPVLAPPQAFAGYTQKIFVRQVERLLEDLSQELCLIQHR